MTCREMEELIALQVSGDLDPRDGRLVEDHLAACESCARLAAGLRADLEEMRALRAEPADEGALAAVRLSVLEQLGSQRARALSPLAWILASSNLRWAAAAVAILLVVVAGLRHAEDTGPPPRKVELAGKAAVPPAADKPAPNPAAGKSAPPLPVAATVHAAATRPAPAATPRRNPVQREESPSVQEDQPIARQVEIIDSNANSGPLSPPATLVKLASSDPDVVLYWLVESNGG